MASGTFPKPRANTRTHYDVIDPVLLKETQTEIVIAASRLAGLLCHRRRARRLDHWDIENIQDRLDALKTASEVLDHAASSQRQINWEQNYVKTEVQSDRRAGGEVGRVSGRSRLSRLLRAG